jgi:hypothetical protein
MWRQGARRIPQNSPKEFPKFPWFSHYAVNPARGLTIWIKRLTCTRSFLQYLRWVDRFVNEPHADHSKLYECRQLYWIRAEWPVCGRKPAHGFSLSHARTQPKLRGGTLVNALRRM